MKRLSHIINKILYIFFIVYSFAFIGIFFYAYQAIQNINARELEIIATPLCSEIYDGSSHLVEKINEKENIPVSYEDLPKNLIYALISIEDNNFFEHNGIDYHGVIRSIAHNLTKNTRQGGSTITQQLVKNLLLSDEISITRKIQEAYLATQLEQNYTKEQILELYFNRIYFDATVPGISYAAKRFFNKEVSLLNLPECALLAGLVKSPSLYSPFRYIERADERKNIVLKAMYENNYISYDDYQIASSINAQEIVINRSSYDEEKNYNYQAYLDIVYEEVKRITGYSLYDRPMKVETYLDTSIQKVLDSIQRGDDFTFADDFTQIAGTIIENSTGGIIGTIGGRNYEGLRLYNRAYHMKRQPASTMKPIFTYALAMEYLDYHEYTMIPDQPYTYPGTNITVSNADKKYLGNISVTDALGYSRNTSTLYTLENVERKIGRKKIVDYLNSIGLDDGGNFTYPYAIGGMTYGVSPISLAGAYSILPRKGFYLTPSVIKSIRYLDTGEIIYDHTQEQAKKVLSEEASYLITSCLKNVRKKNYLNINQAFPLQIECVGKTGTNAYDDKVIASYHYPSNADKDSWFAGYSSHYTIVTWTGFDEPSTEKKTYFGSNDVRRNYSKNMFKKIMEKCENKNQSIVSLPNTMIEQKVVSTTEGTFLANEYVPSNFIQTITRKKEDAIHDILPLPTFQILDSIPFFSLEHDLLCSLPNTEDDLYSTFFGKKGFLIKYQDIDGNTWSQFYTVNECLLPIKNSLFEIQIMETYENSYHLHGEIYTFNTFSL